MTTAVHRGASPIKTPEREKGRGGGLFRIVTGEHIDKGPPGCECPGCRPDAQGRSGMNHRYRARREFERYGEPPQDQAEALGWPVKDGKVQCEGRKGTNGVQGIRYGREIVYCDPPDYNNDLIVSEKDLTLHVDFGGFNARQSIKFIRVDDHGNFLSDGVGREVGQWNNAPRPAPAPEPYPLEKMSVAQLLAVAAEEEIDVRGESKKEKLIAMLQAAGYGKPS